VILFIASHDSSVSVALGYGLEDRGARFDSRRGLGIFVFTTASRAAPALTQPPMQWVTGTLSLGVKRPRREADHSPPSSAEDKNAWSYTSTPQYAFMAWCLLKHRDNLKQNENMSMQMREIWCRLYPPYSSMLRTLFLKQTKSAFTFWLSLMLTKFIYALNKYFCTEK
jgi:hypothetical protein